MSAFLLLAGLMTLAALAAILWPLLRSRAPGARWPASLVVGLAVPALAIGLYLALSNWIWDPAQRPQAGAAPDVEQMVSGLEAKLKNNPGDLQGWLMLGRSHFQLERYYKAADAFQQAYALAEGQNAEAVIGLAEALAFADQSMLMGRSAELFEQAFALAPEHPKVLWYSGLIAYQGGRKALARDRWARLVALDPPPEVKRILQSKVEEIEAELGGGVVAGSSQARAGATPRSAGAAPATEGTPTAGAAQSGGQRAASSAGVVQVRVALSPKLSTQAPKDAPLFVLVRSAEEGGPPLAVTRRTSGELPLLVQLTDRDTMIAGRSLGSSGAVTVVARIARSGGPTARSGDLEGRVKYDLSRSTPVDLVIDSVVP